MTAPEPADLARQHGAPWAKQAIEDELMRIEQIDYSDLPDANLPPPHWEWRVYTVMCVALLLAVLVVVWRPVMSKIINGHDRRWEDLAEMCDYGAARVKDGAADAVRFDVWPTEVEDVKAYMAKSHPETPYQISSPRSESKEQSG